MKHRGINGPVLQRLHLVGTADGDVSEEWHSDYRGTSGPRGGISRCTQLDGLLHYAIYPGDPQQGLEFRAQLGRDAVAVVLAAPVDVELIPPTMAVLCHPTLPRTFSGQRQQILSTSLLRMRRHAGEERYYYQSG